MFPRRGELYSFYPTTATLVCVLSYIKSAVILCIFLSFFLCVRGHLGDGATDRREILHDSIMGPDEVFSPFSARGPKIPVRCIAVFYGNGLTYCHNFFTRR